jgi:hypothetical protein
MSIRRKVPHKLTIDLDGPDGNAFVLMGIAQTLCRQVGKEHSKILADMRKSDYIHLLKVFEKNFGNVVILVTNNEEYLTAFQNDWYDSVFFDESCDAEYIKRSLIEHDRMPRGIEIFKSVRKLKEKKYD